MLERKHKIYHALTMRLKRAGFSKTGTYSKFPNHGAIAAYLCALFLEKEGLVLKSDLVLFKILKEKETSTNEFLGALNKSNFISWNLMDNLKNKVRSYQVYSSSKLTDLLEKEKTGETSSKKEMIVIRAELTRLQKCVKRIISKLDPPFTEEKYNLYTKDEEVSAEKEIDDYEDCV